jgi:hypothetical protein
LVALAVAAVGAVLLLASVFLDLYSFAGESVNAWDGYIRMDLALLAAGICGVVLALAALVSPRPLVLLALAACGLVPLGHASFVLLELPVENGPGLWAELAGCVAIVSGAAVAFIVPERGRSAPRR